MEESVVEVERNDESGAVEKKSSPSLTSPTSVADPVVYKLVRVEGDGRFVPATDDEVIEVEDFLVDDKNETVDSSDTEKTPECALNEVSAAENLQLEGSKEGLSHSENAEPGAEKLVSQDEEKEIVPSSEPGVNESSNNHLSENIVELSKPLEGHPESVASTSSDNSKPSSVSNDSKPSSLCNDSKPNFSKLKGEICFDKLSIRELHELFKATFGRETTVKDKLWLKRRIAMGLTNSCDIPTTKFVIKDFRLIDKGNEASGKDENGKLSQGSPVEEKNVISNNSPTFHGSQMEDNPIASGQMENHNPVSSKRFSDSPELDLGGDEDSQNPEHRAAKRVRKPTKRYIEELSESEPRDSNQKLQLSAKNIGFGQTSTKFCVSSVERVSLTDRIMLTRLDSLGGSGVQIPYVSRVRRSRPRKNIKAFMKFHPSSLGIAHRVMKKASVVPKVGIECMNKVSKSRQVSEQTEPPLTSEAEKDQGCSATITVQLGKNPGESSEDASDDNSATIPTAKGGMRRKHHRAWSLAEVMNLVDGVSQCGAGRWSEIKRLAFASYSYRTSVDLKDKWRNLLKASLAQSPPDEGMNSRRNAASVPIPASILLRVRELAEMHSQSASANLGLYSPTGVGGGKGTHEAQPGYL